VLVERSVRFDLEVVNGAEIDLEACVVLVGERNGPVGSVQRAL
jgi:hypothetical protein